MKTVLKIIFMLFVLFIMAGCEPFEQWAIPPFDPKGVEKPLNIKAEVTCSDLNMYDGVNFDIIGKSSCNLSENTRIGLHGSLNVIDQFTQVSRFEVRNGYFELFDGDQLSYLAGNFEGSALRSYNELKVSGSIEVTFGKGTFEADAGELNVTIYGVLNQDEESKLILTVNIQGYIKKYARAKNQLSYINQGK